MLWDNKTAVEATGGKAMGRWQASRVEIDSRRITPDDLFVALKGERFDGHDFVMQALEKGAAAAVVNKAPHPNPLPQAGEGSAEGAGEGMLLLVPDALKALENLAQYARARSRAKIVGVTGSVGKTSTKEMLRLALAAHGETYATRGNYNNHIGTPLNLANLPPTTPLAVFEMGMNHAGEIAHLTRLVRPHVAVITNIEAVHMEFFNSIEAIADAKAEIFDGMAQGGVAVLNEDNAQFARLAQAAQRRGLRVIGCGTHAECRLERDAVMIDGKTIPLVMKAVGEHWRLNALLALAAVHALGLDIEKSAQALAAFEEPEGRGRVLPVLIDGKAVWLIDDSYNASPASMRAAIAKLDEVWHPLQGKARKIAVLGDMLELGKDSQALHIGLQDPLIAHGIDRVFTAGERMQALYGHLPPALRGAHAAQAMQLLPLLKEELQPGDIVLVKGSHGSKMYELAGALSRYLASPAAAQDNKGKRHAI